MRRKRHFGDANPGGKLPITFPRAVGQIPLYYNHKNTGRPPVEGDRVNTGHPLEDSNHYTSKYLDLPVTQAIVTLLSFIYVGLTLAADLVNAWLDPRIRIG